MQPSAEYGEFEYGEVFYGGGVIFGQTDSDLPFDTEAERLPIPPGSLLTNETLARGLYRQFTQNDNWDAVIDILGDRFGEVDKDIGEIETGRNIYNAVGQQLDEIGAMIDRPRGELVDDEDYRLALLVDWATLFTYASAPEIIALTSQFTEKPSSYRALYPAGFVVVIADLEASKYSLLVEIMNAVPPAGVGAALQSYATVAMGSWGSSYGAVATPGSWGSSHGPTNNRSLWASSRPFASS